mgnify:CR=1 FL=1
MWGLPWGFVSFFVVLHVGLVVGDGFDVGCGCVLGFVLGSGGCGVEGFCRKS